ncbi:MAG: U32 family peptidase [Clostridiales bacterium]|nr:U32 family peptidase [Clostridiales bacterium]
MNKRIELLAPAGNKDIFIKAIDAGADAVYCGIDLYNARLNASNLTMDDLAECCAYAHERSSMVHLTLNTLVNDDEIEEAVNVACEAYNMGVDAILVQDKGLAKRIHERYPMIPLHASTQMNIYDKEGIKSLKGKGFTRVVLPRELTIKEIADRTRYADKLGLETEVFVHGAVCICTSGLCLFSSMNKSGTRSGNRGLCAQPCRQSYELTNNGRRISSGHILSPKDRCAIGFIGELIDAGVASLKIEGRMRDADYVIAAVRAYRKAIDAYYEGTLDEELVNRLEQELLVNFNRGGGFTDQSLSGRKDSNILSGDYVGKFGLRIGKITLRDCKEGTITIRPSKGAVEPSSGDYLSLRDSSGEIKSFPVGKVSSYKGNYVVKGLHPASIKSLPNDVSVYLMNHDFGKSDKYLRRTKIDITFDSSSDGVIKASARVADGPFTDVFAEDQLSYVDEGKRPVDPSRIEEQLRKTGSTAYEVVNVYQSGSDAKCTIKDINELRRGLLETLSSALLSEASHIAVEEFFVSDNVSNINNEGAGEIRTLRYYPSFASFDGQVKEADIYAFSSYDYLDPDIRARIDDLIRSSGKELKLVLPDFCHDAQGSLFLGIKNVSFMPTAGSNIYNTEALKAVLKHSGEAFISYEVDPSTGVNMLRKAASKGNVYVHSGGFVPWMQSDFCPVGRNTPGCKACKGRGIYDLKQENDTEVKVVTHPQDCSCTILGPAKSIWSDGDANKVAEMGYNVIKCYTEV